MTLDKATGNKIIAAFGLLPIIIFAVIYLSGLSGWAATGIAFQDCSEGLQAVFKSTTAMLHIVFVLLLLLAFFGSTITLFANWQSFLANVCFQGADIFWFYKLAMPGTFTFVGAEKVISCSQTSSVFLKLALAYIGACPSLAVGGFLGVVGLIIALAKYKSR